MAVLVTKSPDGAKGVVGIEIDALQRRAHSLSILLSVKIDVLLAALSDALRTTAFGREGGNVSY